MHDGPFDEEHALADAIQKLQAGALTDAADAFQEVLNRNPEHPDALHYLGLTAYQLGQVDAARHLIQQATLMRDPFPDAMANLGSVYRALGDSDQAETWLRKALDSGSPQAAYWFNLGNVLADQDRQDDAASAYREALALNPNHAEAWNGLGVALLALGKTEEATEAYQQAVNLSPDHPEALYNLANAQREAGQLDGAEALLRRAVDVRAGYGLAWNALGNVLADQGRSEEALGAFHTAYDWAPEDARVGSNVLSALQYLDPATPKGLLDKHVEWMWLHHPEAAALEPTFDCDKDPDRSLKLGFVSPDFGHHPVGYFMQGLWPALADSSLEMHAFSTRPSAKSDAVTQTLQAAAKHWEDCSGCDDETLEARIRAAEIDILFDLSGHTAGHRLAVFANKPAPIQMSWLGYVGTTGLATMDYVIGDRFHLPEQAEGWLAERPLRFPHGYALYTPPGDMPDVNALPATSNGYVTFGCLNNPAKLSPNTLDRFTKVLDRVPDSRLLLKFRGLDAPSVKARLMTRLAKAGISTDRVMIEGGARRAEFLETYHRIDLALDTGPYSGGLTTCEALWMGVPVITLPGETFASRHSLSHLSVAGLSECAAWSDTEFIDIAQRLAGDLSALEEMRAGLRAQCEASPLGNAKTFAADFETMMRRAWATWCQQAT